MAEKSISYSIESEYGSVDRLPRAIAMESFKSLKKAREIARYLISSPKSNLRIVRTGGDLKGAMSIEGYVGLSKDYKTYYFENNNHYSNLEYSARYVLKKDGTLGQKIKW